MEYEGSAGAKEGLPYPRCIAGARACPIEEAGGGGQGIDGYQQLLKALARPEHEEHEEMREMMLDWGHHPDEFDPKRFSPSEVVFREQWACETVLGFQGDDGDHH